MNKTINQHMLVKAPQLMSLSRPEHIDLKGMIDILLRRKLLILATIFIATAFTVIYSLSLTSRYTARLQLVFEPTTTSAIDYDAAINHRPQDEATILSEIEILKSRGIAKRVIEKLLLDRVPEFNTTLRSSSKIQVLWDHIHVALGEHLPWLLGVENAPESTAQMSEEERRELRQQWIVDRFEERVDALPVGRSRVVDLRFTSEDPVLAAKIANSIAEQYLVARLEAKMQNARIASGWLASQSQLLRGNVERAERSVEDYRREHNLLQGERMTLTAEQISDLNVKLIQSSMERAAAEANLEQARRLVTKTNDVATLAQVLQSELIQRLRAEQVALERREAEMKQNYGLSHPLMVQLRAEKQRSEETMDIEVKKIIRNLENQVQVTRAREAALSKDYKTLKDQMGQANTASVGLHALERDADASRLLLEKFMAASVETGAQNDVQSQLPNGWVSSQAAIPDRPSFPRKALMIVFALVGGTLIGIPLAFAAEALDTGYRSAEQIEADTGLPVLAHVPKMRPSRGERLVSYVLSRPHSAYAEAIRSLYRSLLIASTDDLPKSVLFVSSEPGEGKTTIALSMARMLSKSGRKVLVIDADLRRAEIAEALQLARTPGLTEFISGSAKLEDIVHRDPQSGCDAIVSGTYESANSDFLTSQILASALHDLKANYDVVVIDAPPLSALSDARVLAGEADSTILIVAWGATRREVVRYTAEQIKNVAPHVAGVVLSKVDLGKQARYGYGDSNFYHGKSRKYYAN